MDITGLGAVFNLGTTIIDKFWPDKVEAERVKIELFKMTQAGEFKELEAELAKAKMQVDVNIAEANSGSNFRGWVEAFCWLGLRTWNAVFGAASAAYYGSYSRICCGNDSVQYARR